MDIIIMHQTVTLHDAVGNDIECMFSILKKIPGIICHVYAENKLNQKLNYINEEHLGVLIQDKKNIIMYHHSVYWKEGEKILKNSLCKIIFRYHNITPESFFKPYNPFHYKQCSDGRLQTEKFQSEFPNAIWLCDSEYNVTDLKELDRKKIAICPPFNKIETWAQCVPDEILLKQLIESKTINLLFVGRVVPNKGHFFLIEMLRVFSINYPEDIKLRIIGKFDDSIDGYNTMLKSKIIEYHLEEYIEFIGEINDEILTSYYLGSDIFVCASEHEGFCVPILEAQYFGLPIVALDRCAIPDTGGLGMVLLENDLKLFAAAIHLLMNKKDYLKHFRKLGMENYNKFFSYEKIEKLFMDTMREVMEG